LTSIAWYGLVFALVAWQITTFVGGVAPAGAVVAPKAARSSPATIDAIAVVAITRRLARLVVTAAPIGAVPPAAQARSDGTLVRAEGPVSL
jgi:hypothetical protein